MTQKFLIVSTLEYDKHDIKIDLGKNVIYINCMFTLQARSYTVRGS